MQDYFLSAFSIKEFFFLKSEPEIYFTGSYVARAD